MNEYKTMRNGEPFFKCCAPGCNKHLLAEEVSEHAEEHISFKQLQEMVTPGAEKEVKRSG